MAKQGQHKRDAHDPRVAKGPNNPDKRVTITAGTPKKQETYEAQARAHADTAKQAQAADHEWRDDTRDPAVSGGATRARRPRAGRSGSDSNAS